MSCLVHVWGSNLNLVIAVDGVGGPLYYVLETRACSQKDLCKYCGEMVDITFGRLLPTPLALPVCSAHTHFVCCKKKKK